MQMNMNQNIHIMRSDGFAKIELEDLKFALEIVKENQNEFERIWDEWFN